MSTGDGLVVYDLFYETEEDGDDDGCFDGLAEDDEEDGDGEEVFGHGGRAGVMRGRKSTTL